VSPAEKPGRRKRVVNRSKEPKGNEPGNGPITDGEVEGRIREFFDRNYDLFRQEGGHVLAEGAKLQALEQTLLYWRKLKAIATSVTETEVKLALPGLKTPKGRPFVLEGVVDIVRKGKETYMYDLKTHEESEVRAERELYEDQLNVYANIWKGVRGQGLDGTAIIATRLPAELREALRAGSPAAIEAAMATWDPVVELPFNENEVVRTIQDFGRCVDQVEDGAFAPPPSERLGGPAGTRRRRDHGELVREMGARRQPTFAEINCKNCDARFSCRSHRDYARKAGSPRSRRRRELDETAERELDAWIADNLEA
jgi:hypothetical protein